MLIIVNPSSNFNFQSKKFFRFENIFILKKNKKKSLFNDKFFISIDGYITDKNDKKLSKKFILNKFFKLQTSSEILNSVKGLGGAFIIFLYDIKKKKTYLFKDEDGYKPLFYKKVKSSLLISSNIKYLKSIIKLSINYNFLKKYIIFRYNYIYGYKETFFKKVFFLPAASCLFFYKSYIKVLKYSNYEIKMTDLSFQKAKNEIINEMIRIFKIKKNEFNHKSILALSGGMDSTSAAYLIYKATGKKIDSCTANYNIKKCDIEEVSQAKKVGKKFSKKWIKIKINSEDFFNSWKKIYRNYSIPLPTGSSLGYHILYSKVSNLGYNKVINSGNPDHYFFGNYPAYLYNLSDLYYQKKKEFNNELKSWIVNHSTKQFPKSKKLFYKFYKNNISKKKLFTIEPQIEILGKKYLKSYPKNIFSNSFSSKSSFLNAHLKMGLWQSERQPGIIAFDELSNIQKVKSLDPFVGERLKKLTYSLPASYKIYKGNQKFIFRKIMEEYLPESIIKNKNKIGFDLPFLHWINNDLKIKKFVINLLLSVKSSSFFDFININKIIEDLESKKFNDHMFLWQLTNSIMWIKNNMETK